MTATLFSFALLFPTVLKFAHILEGHEHKACTETSTHLHKKQLDCSICDFHFSTFNFTPNTGLEFEVLHHFGALGTVYLASHYYMYPATYFLRGPPHRS